jgi:hypothetical protein
VKGTTAIGSAPGASIKHCIVATQSVPTAHMTDVLKSLFATSNASAAMMNFTTKIRPFGGVADVYLTPSQREQPFENRETTL